MAFKPKNLNKKFQIPKKTLSSVQLNFKPQNLESKKRFKPQNFNFKKFK